jgi:hypothetical protein
MRYQVLLGSVDKRAIQEGIERRMETPFRGFGGVLLLAPASGWHQWHVTAALNSVRSAPTAKPVGFLFPTNL